MPPSAAARRLVDRPMTIEEFQLWDPGDDVIYELIDGWPVPRFPQDGPLAMSGPTPAHAALVSALSRHLGNHFARTGRPCRAEASPLQPLAQSKSGRRARVPDLIVRCGGARPRDATDVIVVVEITSPSDRPGEIDRRARDYQTLPTLQEIVRLEQDAHQARILRRAGELWPMTLLVGPDETLRLPAIGFEISLSELYEDVLPPTTEAESETEIVAERASP